MKIVHKIKLFITILIIFAVLLVLFGGCEFNYLSTLI